MCCLLKKSKKYHDLSETSHLTTCSDKDKSGVDELVKQHFIDLVQLHTALDITYATFVVAVAVIAYLLLERATYQTLSTEILEQ